MKLRKEAMGGMEEESKRRHVQSTNGVGVTGCCFGLSVESRGRLPSWLDPVLDPGGICDVEEQDSAILNC